jgi:hypothetical protein
MVTNRDDNTPLPKLLRRVTDSLSTTTSALAVQVSGDHYKTAKIQPIEFIHANNIPFCEANVIKYIFRWKAKNGIKDLEKAKHYIDLLIELESKNV